MTVGKDVSALFPDVVNCMQTDNLELKKLVYLYLMNYAKTQPDMAIMAVNTFVKVLQIFPFFFFFVNTTHVFLYFYYFFFCIYCKQLPCSQLIKVKLFGFCLNLQTSTCLKKQKSGQRCLLLLFCFEGLRRSKSVDTGLGCTYNGLYTCR